ncbi:glycoside hydrolase family 78 protein [Paenibacillus albidus]|nr:hypothetical protein [Paenibacillus albidus]
MSILVTDCRTGYLKNPLGLDVQHPRLFWKLDTVETSVWQTAYQILDI